MFLKDADMPECAFNHCLRGGASVLLQQPFFYRTTVDAHADHRAPRFGGIDHHFHVFAFADVAGVDA